MHSFVNKGVAIDDNDKAHVAILTAGGQLYGLALRGSRGLKNDVAWLRDVPT